MNGLSFYGNSRSVYGWFLLIEEKLGLFLKFTLLNSKTLYLSLTTTKIISKQIDDYDF